jgi:hypothetical protein
VQGINRTTSQSFPTVETWQIEIPLGQAPSAPHKVVTENFIRAILADEPLIARGAEGARGLEIGNAMLLAGITRQPAQLPLDSDSYARFLQELQERFGGEKHAHGVPAAAAPENPLPPAAHIAGSSGT